MRRALPLLLALVLLSGWHQALMHPLQHVDAHGTLVHAPGPEGDDHDHNGEHGIACDALAALTSCISTAAAPVTRPARAVVEFAVSAARPAPPAAPHAYDSQAPPVLS